MQRTDPPAYLKNSRFLNNLSVQKLLRYWSVICACAVILLSIAAVITNDVISSRQKILDEQLVPVANILRILEEDRRELDKLYLSLQLDADIEAYLKGRARLSDQINNYLQQLAARTSNIQDLNNLSTVLISRYRTYLDNHKSMEIKLRQALRDQQNQTAEIPLNKDQQFNELRSKIFEQIPGIQEMLVLLSRLTAEKINKQTSISNDISQVNLMVVVTLSLLVIAVIIAGISLIIFRIGEPLLMLKEAMHDLSEGDLARRMQENEKVRDEFALLSRDFNNFASRNEHLFEEVLQTRDALQESEQRTRAILENALVGIAHVKDDRIVSVNRKFEEIFGYDREEVTGMKKELLYTSLDENKSINEAANRLLSNNDIFQDEWKMKHKNGTHFWCAVSAKAISKDNIGEGIIWLFEDITQRKQQEEDLLRLANFDTLTGLPNRSLCMDRLEQGIGRSSRKNSYLGLLYVDLDRFKKVNDSLGHGVGDELLKNVSSRLFECVRNSDTVCRLGGDEFTIILPEIQDISDAGKVAEKIITVMDRPFIINNNELNISPSIGVSIYPDDAEDMETLLKNADSAMYHAKSRGRNNYQYYTQTMNAEARQRLDKENRLRHAIESDQFILYYQPQVDTKKLKVTGYEALVRWQDANDGLVTPDQFIPLLEDSGLIISVGEWILRQACSDVKELISRNPDFKSVSVNLSARQFVDDTIVDRVKQILEETNVKPENIVIEITESILMTETERSLQILSSLNKLGLKLSLDDFGTGYSSLAYLKQFPIDVIKIDQTFVQGLDRGNSDAAICEAIIAIAHQLGLKVVAEGVETQDQFNYMRDRECHSIQGFFFGGPMPLEQLVCHVDKALFTKN